MALVTIKYLSINQLIMLDYVIIKSMIAEMSRVVYFMKLKYQ